MTSRPKWTQTEAIAFECACECITDLRAILTGQIYEETNKEHPDAERIARLRAERSELFRERAGLHVHDHVEVARVRVEYGSKIRAWRADAERRKRQAAVNFACASVRLEGFKPSHDAEEIAARFVAGEIDLAEVMKPAR